MILICFNQIEDTFLDIWCCLWWGYVLYLVQLAYDAKTLRKLIAKWAGKYMNVHEVTNKVKYCSEYCDTATQELK